MAIKTCFYMPYIFFFFEPYFLVIVVKPLLSLQKKKKKRHKSGLVLPCLLACKHFYGVTHSVWLEKTSLELQSILCKNKGCLGSFCNTSHSYHTDSRPLCWRRGILRALWVLKIFRHTIECKQPSRT